MKFTLSQDALLAALERVGKVVEARNTIPILGNLRLEARAASAEGPDLVITGTDLDMEMTTRVPVHVDVAGATTVPAGTCRDFVRKLPEGKSVEVAADPAAGRVTLKCGRSRLTLPSLPAQDFPSLAGGAWPTTFSLPAQELGEMLARVSFAISTEETRYYLNGVYLHVRTTDGIARLAAVATDGHRLGLHAAPLPDGAADMPGIIVPRKAAAEIARMIKGIGTEPIAIAASTTKLRVTAGASTLVTKLVDGTFPDYDRVIPSAGGHTARLPKEEMAAAVDRIATILSGQSRATKFRFDADRLALSASVEGNEATDEIEGEGSGGPLEIGFNSGYVLDILRVLPGETMHIAMSDPGSPCLVTAPAAPESLFVLMPMRV